MIEYAELLERLRGMIGDDSSKANIYKQASDAIERLLALSGRRTIEVQPQEEPTDHEAEGAMRYVMSRGRH
jgi:hypothetical protein